MKIISWNINGLRAVYKKGFLDWFLKEQPDILCLQEIKSRQDQAPLNLQNLAGYFSYFNSANKPGYSGVAIFCKQKPEKVEDKIGLQEFDQEGRVLKLTFPKFVLYNFYMPNGGKSPEAFDLKLKSYDYLIKKIGVRFAEVRPLGTFSRSDLHIILAGDFNIAHKEIDIARPKENAKNVGFTIGERDKIDKLLQAGFVDSFRVFHQEPGQYTWWRPFADARSNNVGWRIDYVFVSDNLKSHLKSAFILPHVMGSDHCPAGIDIF